MQKCNRREAMIFLLGGLVASGGLSLTQGKQTSIPEGCVCLSAPQLDKRHYLPPYRRELPEFEVFDDLEYSLQETPQGGL